jgi:hypothetical protein
MKKITVLALLVLLLSTGGLFAQCTPNGSITSPGFYPLPSNPLPGGTVGTPYSQVITINVPADTTVDLSGLIGFPVPPVTATINFLSLGTVNGLPAGISSASNPGTGQLPGGTSGCIDISGTPTTSGQYVFNIPTTLNIQVPAGVPIIGGTPQNIPGQVPYNMEVTGATYVLPEPSDLVSIFPNPITNFAYLHLNLQGSEKVNIDLFDMNGKHVYHTDHAELATSQYLRIWMQDMPAGMYVCKVQIDEEVITRRLIKE